MEIYDSKNPDTLSNLIEKIPLVKKETEQKQIDHLKELCITSQQKSLTMKRATPKSQVVKLSKDDKVRLKNFTKERIKDYR